MVHERDQWREERNRLAAALAETTTGRDDLESCVLSFYGPWKYKNRPPEVVVQRASPGEVKSLADRPWGHLSRRVVAAEERGARQKRERAVKLAEEMEAEALRDEREEAGAALREFTRRLREEA